MPSPTRIAANYSNGTCTNPRDFVLIIRTSCDIQLNVSMPHFQDSRCVYLYEAATRGTIRAAAERLGVAPSAVSRQISLLEDELGTILIERHRSGVVPTEAGQLMIDYYRQHAAHRYDMMAKIDALRGLQKGSVSVVCGEGFAENMITGPVREFHRDHPGIAISLEITGTTEIMRRVTEDEVEIGLVYYAPADAQIVSRRSAHQPMFAIVGPNNPLRYASGTTLSELQEWPIALLKGVYGIRQIIEDAEREERVRLHPTLTTNLISVLASFVANDQGVTLLPPFSVATAIKNGELHAVPVKNAALQNAEVQLITRAGRHLSPAANRFLQYCMRGMQAFEAFKPA